MVKRLFKELSRAFYRKKNFTEPGHDSPVTEIGFLFDSEGFALCDSEGFYLDTID